MKFHDQEIQRLIEEEGKRQESTLNLIPSENYVSDDVLGALGSSLTNKYAEGYSGKRYYGGNGIIDQIEDLCASRALSLFGLSENAWHVNTQAYSGSPANLAALMALAPLGGKIMGLKLDMGGHLTHGHGVSATGKLWKSIQYSVDEKTGKLDYGKIMAHAKRERPHVIIAGFTAYPWKIDFAAFRKIADAVEAKLLVDMSHIAGLVAGGVHPSPFHYADVVTTTTHKTLRGPRGALIFSRLEYARAVDRAIFPGLQGGPHINQIAGAAVALEEAKTTSFRHYAEQIIKNAKALSEALKKEKWTLVGGGTETHLLLVDLSSRKLLGHTASNALESQGIIVNKNTVPYDVMPPTTPSGIRLGTPALTTRGMKEKEMKKIASLITKVLIEKSDVQGEVKKLCKEFPIPSHA